MTIKPLADEPTAIQQLAQWFHEQWHAFDGRTVEAIATQLAENLNREAIPITFIACGPAGLLGTVSLDLSDLRSFKHLSPWLASLYVAPGVRGQGIGSALLKHAQEFACSQGMDSLYLWTPGSTRLYERYAWRVLERGMYHRRPITVMQFDGKIGQ